jgi:uncharacterized protein DUF5684
MKSLIELTQNLFHYNASLLAQVQYSYSSQGKAPGPFFWICEAVFIVLMIAAMWKIFVKAGQPGWAAIIPIYNWIVWCKIVGRPAWWVLLLLICFPIFFIILSIDLAKSFGKGAASQSALSYYRSYFSLSWDLAARLTKGRPLRQKRRRNRYRLSAPLHQPVRLALFVKCGDAFAGFSRFASLHVILERKVDIFLH